MRDLAFGDEAQFLFRQLAHFVRNAFADSVSQARFGQIAQMPVGGLARRHRFMRIILFEFVQGESDAVREAQRFVDRFGAGAEQPRHFRRGLQMPFGIGLKPLARLVPGSHARGCR